MVRYMRPHGRFSQCSCKNAVRQPPVLTSCIEIYYSCTVHFFRVFRRIKIKYRIIIIKFCMRKCEIVKKNQNSYICNNFKKLLFICNLKKNVMLTGLFTGHFANSRYVISIIATYYIEIKKKPERVV